MKSIKMLGLAALAALLAMAFVGASSAMAEPTLLCSNDSTTSCTSVTHVHETSVGKGVLKSSLPTIECNVLFLGDAESPAAPLTINGQFSYSSCNNFCTVKEETANATIEVLRTASELAAVTGEGLVNVKCPFINCNYVGTGLEGHGLGPLTSSQANGSVVLTEQNTEKESGSCPEEAFLTLTTTPLSATYIRPLLMACIQVAAGTGLYKSAGSNGNCETMTGSNTRDGNYELAWIRQGINVNEMVCGFVGFPNGLLLRMNAAGTECELKDTNREGAYELGTVVNVA